MSDYVKRLRDARNWFNNDGQCCGQVDSVGTCAAPACIFGEALKEFFLAADCIEAQAARIAELEVALAGITTWVARWSDHVGSCLQRKNKTCSCGRDFNLYEACAALTGGKDEDL